MAKIRISDDLELAYEESGAGNGRPIIFIHGVWMSARFFHRQLPELGKNHHAIVKPPFYVPLPDRVSGTGGRMFRA